MQILRPIPSQPVKKESKFYYVIPLLLLIASFTAGKFIFKPKLTVVADNQNTEKQAENSKHETEGSLLQIDSSMARTEACPLNGEKYTTVEKQAWQQRRPLAVMIENSQDARPQSGLSKADIVFELVAEGGITRFMAMYYCDAQKDDVLLAPIRSARTYYINLASGFNRPMYVHVGGANDDSTPETHALNQIESYGWAQNNDINQFSVGYPTFIRDYNRIPGKEVATEHTMTTTTEKLWAVAKKRGWTNMSPDTVVKKTTVPGTDWAKGYTGWDFAEMTPSGNEQTVSYDFWGTPGFEVSWKYDKDSNAYIRSNGKVVQKDLNSDAPLAFRNVVVMFAKERGPLNEVKHMMYDVIGKGEGILFSGGSATPITWEKKTRESELTFSKPLQPGKVWVSVIKIGNKVTY